VRPPRGFGVTRRPAAVRGCGCRSRAARRAMTGRHRGRKWTWTSSPQSVGGAGGVVRPGLLIHVAAASRGVTAGRMPTGSGLASLADGADRERRDGFSQLVIRGKDPMACCTAAGPSMAPAASGGRSESRGLAPRRSLERGPGLVRPSPSSPTRSRQGRARAVSSRSAPPRPTAGPTSR